MSRMNLANGRGRIRILNVNRSFDHRSSRLEGNRSAILAHSLFLSFCSLSLSLSLSLALLLSLFRSLALSLSRSLALSLSRSFSFSFLDASSHLYNWVCPSVRSRVTLSSKMGKSMILIANNDVSCNHHAVASRSNSSAYN